MNDDDIRISDSVTNSNPNFSVRDLEENRNNDEIRISDSISYTEIVFEKICTIQFHLF